MERELRSSMSGTTRSTTRRTNGHGRPVIERVGTKEARTVRSQSQPVTPEQRLTSPYEETKPWKDLGYANLDESFLYPTNDPPCPIAQSQSMSKSDQEQYMKWIADVLKIDKKKSKDERVYCPYCDMNNHPRFSCKHFSKHLREQARHQCTLRCMSNHAPFQCARAQVNGGIAKPNWTRREKKLAADQNREPDLRWDAEGNAPPPVPPPVEAPPQEGHQQAQQEAQQPLCAAAVMMRGPPPTMRHSNYRQSAACPTVLEGCEWTEAQQEEEKPRYPRPGHDIPANLWNLDVPSRATTSFLRHVTSMQSPESKLCHQWPASSE